MTNEKLNTYAYCLYLNLSCVYSLSPCTTDHSLYSQSFLNIVYITYIYYIYYVYYIYIYIYTYYYKM